MALQYLSDQSGKTTAVVIPIEEWEALTEKHADLRDLEQAEKPLRRKPSEFRGTLSPELAEQLQQHVKQAREEWDRNSF